MAAKYRYYLDFGSGNVEIIPDKDIKYIWQKDSQYEGFMRKKIDKLIFSKDFDNQGTFTNATPFNTLWEWYFDITKHTTEIKLQVFENDVFSFESVFYVTDGGIDVNTGTYTIKPTTNDDYRILLQVMDNEVDIILNTSGTYYNAQFTYTTVNQEQDTGSITQAPDYPASPSSWTQATLRYGSGTTVWVREQSQFDLGSQFGITPIKTLNRWYYAYDSWGGSAYDGIEETFDFPNCYLLTDSIQVILDEILDGTTLSGMTFESDFINEGTSYVTGDANKLMNTLIEQRSDTKDPDATNKALVGKISLKELLGELKKMWEVSWFIDESGNFRIEHEMFFYNGASLGTKTVGVDLTNLKYVDDGADKYYVEDTQAYEGAGADKSKSETIKFPDEQAYDFRGDMNYIEYDVVSDIISKKEHNVTFFSTDVGKAINTPDDILDDGFFMFNCDDYDTLNGNYPIISRPSGTTIDAQDIINSAFSVKWLLKDYYEYNRQDKSGVLVMSGDMTDTYAVIGSKPIYLQKDISFLLHDDDTIDINKYIKTFLIKSDGGSYSAYGTIVKIEHDLSDDFVKVTLGYEL